MRSPGEPYYTRYAAQAIRNEVLQRYPVADPVSVNFSVSACTTTIESRAPMAIISCACIGSIGAIGR